MKKIVIITNIPAPYRVDMFYYLQKTLEHQYEIHVVYSASNASENREWESDQQKILHSHFLASKSIDRSTAFDYKHYIISSGIIRTLNEIKPHLAIIMEYNQTAFMTSLYCKTHGIPYVSWTDGTIHSERNINMVQKMIRFIMISGASAYLASSMAARDNQIKLGADTDKIFISPLTVDIQKYLYKKENYEFRYRLISVGSLIQRKGMDILIREVAANPKLHLDIVGVGPEKDALTGLTKELKLEDRVCFMDFLQQREIEKCYQQADAFILCTREDCYGLVILEAMCASLPVIVSKFADGSRELVQDGENGYVIDIHRSEDIQKAINNVFSEKYQNMCQKSYEIAQNFEISKAAQPIMKVIQFAEKKEHHKKG